MAGLVEIFDEEGNRHLVPEDSVYSAGMTYGSPGQQAVDPGEVAASAPPADFGLDPRTGQPLTPITASAPQQSPQQKQAALTDAQRVARASMGQATPLGMLATGVKAISDLTGAPAVSQRSSTHRSVNLPDPAQPPSAGGVQADPTLTAIATAGAAGGQARADMPDRLTTTSVARESARLTPDAANRSRLLLEQKRRRGIEGVTAKTAALLEKRAILEDQRRKAKIEVAALGEGQTETKKRLLQQRKTVADDMQLLKEAEVDPGRYLEKMSGTKRVVFALSAALGGFVEGFTGGKVKNNAFALLNQAIERDIAAQRFEYRKRLQQFNLDQRQESRLLTEYDKGADRQKELALRSSRLQLMKGDVAEQEADVLQGRTLLLGEIEKELRSVNEAATGRKRVTSTSSPNMAKFATAGQPKASKDSQRAEEAFLSKGMSRLDRLLRYAADGETFQDVHGKGIVRYYYLADKEIPGRQANKLYKGEMGMQVLGAINEVSGKAFSQRELKTTEGSLFGAAATAETRAQAVDRLTRKAVEAQRNQARMAFNQGRASEAALLAREALRFERKATLAVQAIRRADGSIHKFAQGSIPRGNRRK